MRALPLFFAAALAAPSVANACGGFFCNPTPPYPGGPVEVVDQAGEDVLFFTNEDEGTVTMHVQVAFEGNADDFAWVIPVKGDPSIELSTDAVFPVLRTLRAQFLADVDFDNCDMNTGTYSSSSWGSGTGTGTGTGGGGVNTFPGVDLVRSGAVGPYETVTLQANNSEDLIGWLQANSFELPPGLDPLLASYISPDTYFVALRLGKDSDTGDLQPISLTYPGDTPAIPIQLTSVAATPDMRLRVYVLGDARAVPLSYLHVRLNPLALDFWNGGDNLDDVVTQAANEAGGHAFFTDYSGPTGNIEDQVFQSSWDAIDLTQYPDAAELLLTIADNGLPLDDRMQDILADHLDLPNTDDPGLDLPEVIECLTQTTTTWGYGYYGSGTGTGTGGTTTEDDCWAAELSLIVFDPIALAADVEELVMEPRRRVEDAIQAAHRVTRLTSSISPAEMTVDPTFGFNFDMNDQEQTRVLDETYVCDGDRYDESWRRLDTSFGDSLWIPPLSVIGFDSPYWWLDEEGYTQPAALVIERTSENGPPDVIVDNTHLVFGERFDDEGLKAGAAGGCGCRSTDPASPWLLMLPLLVSLRRTRRS